MKIGILGTRGVPNHYGGFEQFAEYLSVGLVERGHEVVVYNSSTHPYQKDNWKGVKIVHCKDLEDKIGTAGQFFYDLNCILNARKQGFSVLLQLGYTSNSIWYNLLPKNSIIVTNMDGLEWKRSKYSKMVQLFLRKAEKWAAESSDHLIADSIGILKYLEGLYDRPVTFISYGSESMGDPNVDVLREYGLVENQYYLLIARMEPENNIEIILDGYVESNSSLPFIVVGKVNNSFGQYLQRKFEDNPLIIFKGGIYNFSHLNNLRFYSKFYFHGHSVGGTNPSLLEAMSSSALIVANDNIFNRTVLDVHALYFSNSFEVASLINKPLKENSRKVMIEANLRKIEKKHSWKKIIDSYLNLFIKLTKQNRVDV